MKLVVSLIGVLLLCGISFADSLLVEVVLDDEQRAVIAKTYGPHFARADSEHFAIYFDTPEPPYDLAFALEEGYDRYYRTCAEKGFEVERPKERLVCVIFAGAIRFADAKRARAASVLEWPAAGRYLADFDEVVMAGVATRHLNPTRYPKVAAHELGHQLSFHGLLRKGVKYPFWVPEGLAMYFETELVNVMRLEFFLAAKEGERMKPFSDFFVLSRLPYHPDPRMGAQLRTDAYAQGWALFSFLIERHPAKLKEFLREYAELAVQQGCPRAERDVERSTLAAFTKAFDGMTMDDLEEEWNEWCAALPAPSQATP